MLPIPSGEIPVLWPHPIPDWAAAGRPLLKRFITPSPSLWKRGGTTVKHYCWAVPVDETRTAPVEAGSIGTQVTEVSCYQHLLLNSQSRAGVLYSYLSAITGWMQKSDRSPLAMFRSNDMAVTRFQESFRLLFISQGHHGIDLHGSSRRQIAGQQRYHNQQCASRDECQWIIGAKAKE